MLIGVFAIIFLIAKHTDQTKEVEFELSLDLANTTLLQLVLRQLSDPRVLGVRYSEDIYLNVIRFRVTVQQKDLEELYQVLSKLNNMEVIKL